MSNKVSILEIQESTVQSMDSACLEQARKDFGIYFFDIYGRARSIAADKQRNNEKLRIVAGNWEEAKWRAQLNWGQKKKPIVRLMEFLMIIGPTAIGYGISEPSKLWPYLVGGLLFTSIVYIIKVSYEK